MTRSHMILCSAAAAVLGLAGCQGAEEREAAVQRDAFAQLVDEVEGKMNEELTLLQTLWDIELEYGAPERSGRTLYRFFPTDPTAQVDTRRARYERQIEGVRSVSPSDPSFEFLGINLTQQLQRALEQLQAAIPAWQERIDTARATIAAEQAEPAIP